VARAGVKGTSCAAAAGGTLIDLLSVWAPDEATRKRILVDNPEALYGF